MRYHTGAGAKQGMRSALPPQRRIHTAAEVLQRAIGRAVALRELLGQTDLPKIIWDFIVDQKDTQRQASDITLVESLNGQTPTPSAYPTLSGLIGGMVEAKRILTHWDEILRLSASIRQGTTTASLMLRKLGSYLLQNRLAVALRELGRVERTLFTLEWLQDLELRRHRRCSPGRPRCAR